MGYLIVFEGLDGSGKTVLSKRLTDQLNTLGLRAIWTYEPTHQQFGKILRSSFSGDRLTPAEELRLFVNDRKQHVDELIQPHLDNGGVVICDRYFISNMAYQGARGLDVDKIYDFNRFAPLPDLWFYIDVSLQTCFNRMKLRGAIPNSFEDMEYLQQVMELYQKISFPHKVKINNEDSLEEVQKHILWHAMHLMLFTDSCYNTNNMDSCSPTQCLRGQNADCEFLDLIEIATKVRQI